MLHARTSPGAVRLKIEALIDGLRTAKAIAEIVGCRTEYVNHVARVAGLRLAPNTLPPHHITTVWTAERVVLLEKYWLVDELSAAETAARLGHGITREAVCGKVGRLRLRKRKAEAATLIPIRPSKRTTVKARLVIEAYDLPPPVAGDLARKLKPLAELKDADCRYPVGHVGEKGFGFCAAEKMPGSSYCPVHHARCSAPKLRVISAGDAGTVPANELVGA